MPQLYTIHSIVASVANVARVASVASVALAGAARADTGARTLDETLATPIDGAVAGAPSGSPTGSPADTPTNAPIVGATETPRPRFGEMDSLRLNILVGYGNDFDETQLYTAGVGLSWFFVDNVSLDLELTGLGIDQPGPSAGAFDATLLFRWHFLARERWSVYFEGGAGLLWSTEDVPPDGTSFNFAPQVGFGATYEIADDIRLMGGVRWFHISNARLSADNPGLDSALVYVGISLPL